MVSRFIVRGLPVQLQHAATDFRAQPPGLVRRERAPRKIPLNLGKLILVDGQVNRDRIRLGASATQGLDQPPSPAPPPRSPHPPFAVAFAAAADPSCPM
jgi:hypothetical protein